MDARKRRARFSAVGALLVAVIYASHVYTHVTVDDPVHLFWFCNVALLWILGAFLLRSGTLAGVGLVWAIFGTPIWLFDLFAGSELLWTSLMTHFGGVGLAVAAARLYGVAPGTWWRCLAFMVPLHVASYLFTPPELNINLAHGIYPGFEELVSSYPVYIGSFYVAGALLGLALEWLVRSVLGWEGPEEVTV